MAVRSSSLLWLAGSISLLSVACGRPEATTAASVHATAETRSAALSPAAPAPIEVAWVVHPSQPDADKPEVYELRRRSVELVVRTGTERKRVLLPSQMGVLAPTSQSACHAASPGKMAELNFGPRESEPGTGFAVRITEPGHLAVVAWSQNEAACAEGTCSREEHEIAQLAVSPDAPVGTESIVVMDHTGKARRLDCRSEKPQ